MQTKSRPIELLSPAKDLNCGIEAINHGADAVYIGAPKFGARSAAGNSLEDIRELCEYAHLYEARIYVTLNTILKEDELEEAERMIWDLWRVGTDAPAGLFPGRMRRNWHWICGKYFGIRNTGRKWNGGGNGI